MGRAYRFTFILLDHGLLALASFVVLSSVARSSSQFEFGVFALAQMAHVAISAVYRTILGSWVLTSTDPRTDQPAILSLTFVYGGLALTSYGLAVLAVGQGLSVVMLATWLLGQPVLDFGRFCAIRRETYGPAALLSAVVFGTTVLTSLIVELLVTVDVWIVVAAYGASAFVAGGAFALFNRVGLQSIRASWAYWCGRRTEACQQGIVAASQVIPALGTVGLVSVLASPALVAALRGAQVIVGFALQIPQAVQPMFLAKYANSYAASGSIHRGLRLSYFACQVVPLMLLAVFFAYIPKRWGEALIGNTWNDASNIAWLLILSALFAQLSTEVELRLRVLKRLRVLGPVQLGWTIASMGFAAAGAYFGGAFAMAAGLLLANAGKYLSSLIVAKAEAKLLSVSVSS